MNWREWLMVIASLVATIGIVIARYFFDQWIFASGLPNWLKIILVHGS